MKIFAVISIFAVLGGSNAMLGGIADLFHNLGQQLGDVGKDLLHVAEPVATSLLTQLEQAGTQLLTTAASDLLSHLGTGTSSKRDLGAVVSQIGSFVTNGEEYLNQVSSLLEGAFKGTIAKIHSEIESVLNDEKPLEKLVNEVKSVIDGHNNFVDDLISKADQEGMKLVGDVLGMVHPKRDEASTASSFGQSLQQLLQNVTAPLKSVLSNIVSSLETKVLGLLG